MSPQPFRPLMMADRIGGQSPENQAIIAASDTVFKLAERCDVCGEGSEELIINLVLDIAGPILGVDYTGLRTGRLWRAERVLMIQAAVPAPLETDVWDFLEDVLRGALALATEYVADHKLGYSLKAVTKCIDEVIAALPRTKEDPI